MAYFRHVVRIDVLTDRKVTGEELEDLGNLDYESDQGAWVARIDTPEVNVELTAEEMADRLAEAGSTPSFFGIGEEGEDD